MTSKGQHRPKVNNLLYVRFLKSSIFTWLTTFEEDLYFRSLNSTSQLFLRSTQTKRSTGQRSTTKVVFLKSSIFIWLTWNLKRIYISIHWNQPAKYFWGQHGPKCQHRPKVNNFGKILISSIFIQLTWNFKRIYISVQWNQPANYFWSTWIKGQQQRWCF